MLNPKQSYSKLEDNFMIFKYVWQTLASVNENFQVRTISVF